VYDAIFAEKNNKPTVTLVNKDFLNDALSAASSQGMPVLRVVPTSVPCESSVIEDIKSGVDSSFVTIIDSLIKPLTEEEKAPKSKEIENPSRIVFKGDLEDVNRFFYKRGWIDGLPIIPPTEEKVAEMLKGTDLPADHVVAKIIPRLGKATVEKIAINAVMAGALPIYMPVLIAGVKLLAHEDSSFDGMGVSTGSWAPFWIVNGPVRNDINLNSGTGALSPGNIANAAIGRAMGLIIKNIGGIRKGVEDMGVQGNPGKYSMVLGENEEASPWEPLHVERGFKKEDSTIALFFPNIYMQVWPYGSDDEGILRSIIYNLPPGRGALYLVLTPPHAKTLAQLGWTKKDVQLFISEYARVPFYRLGSYWGISSNPASSSGGKPMLFGKRVPIREMDQVSVLRDPNMIQIIVAGGPGAFMGMHLGGGLFPARKVTMKIDLPANWDKLVQKYKNIVPTYIRY
jgi:hypothetical protein